MNTAPVIERLVPTVYEDDRLLAVVKPAGVDAGGRRDEPSHGLAELLSTVRKLAEPLIATHRLSRYESGVLVLAKDEETAAQVRRQFKVGTAVQTYLAIVDGRVKGPTLTVGREHGASRGRRTAATTRGAAKQGVAAAPASKTAPTTLSLLRTTESGSLVQCTTAVGTTHSLRAQLRAAGHRLRGDARGTEVRRRAAPVDETLLHLARLALRPPSGGRELRLQAPQPKTVDWLLTGRKDIERPLAAALARRLPMLLERETDAFRLLSGPAEDLPGLNAEKYGDVIVLQVLEDSPEVARVLRPVAEYLRRMLDARSVYVKRFAKDRGGVTTDASDGAFSAAPLIGAPAPAHFAIREKALRFMIRPYDGNSVGLFLDQRENRARIKSRAAGKTVLNLFAYTCGFSVAAAAGGAAKVTSVDLSPRSLEWGKQNFSLNGLDPSLHEFVAADAMDYLGRAASHERQFDVVIADAPTFAHGRKSGRHFSIASHLTDLVAAAAAVTKPGGTLLLSTNNRRLTWRAFRERAQAGLRQRKGKIVDTPDLPLDYAVDPDHAKTVVVSIA